jgi:hypothetical protein
MELTKPCQRPSAPLAARVSVAHEPFGGRQPAWSLPASGRSARLLVARGHQIEGRNVSTYQKFAGAGIPAANARQTGDVSGVPPRGKPV